MTPPYPPPRNPSQKVTNLQPSVTLDGGIVIGAIGSLAGAIGLLFNYLLAAKNTHISSLLKELEEQRIVFDGEIESVAKDRDYWRDLYMRQRNPPRAIRGGN